jgi:hypothetical protein
LLLPIFIYASKPGSIRLGGIVCDEFTKENISHVFITLMRVDSTVIDTVTTQEHKFELSGSLVEIPKGAYEFSVQEAGSYILKLETTGYHTCYHSFMIPLKKYGRRIREWTENVEMKKAQKIHQLQGEAIVTATKIKMVMKGDTLVFNADAFQLSEGSMLDQLLNQIPGMKINAGGDITLNGQHVQSLLVNGKDFFSGNAKIALENLPAYMVDKVKVYRRSADNCYLQKDRVERDKNKQLVIDVNLKKEYHQGQTVNIDIGDGTNGTYLAKIMAMHYTDRTRLFVFTNFNNINNTVMPISNGESGPPDAISSGIQKLKVGGFQFNWNARKSKAEFNTSFYASQKITENQQKSSNVTYLSASNIYNRNEIYNIEHETHLYFHSHYTYPGKKIHLNFSPQFDYTRVRSDGMIKSAQFNSDPVDKYLGASLDSIFLPIGSKRLNSLLIHRVYDQTAGLNKQLNAKADLTATFISPFFGNSIKVNCNGLYFRQDPTFFSQYDLKQSLTGKEDFRNRYTLQPERHENFLSSLQYGWTLGNGLGMNMNYQYQQQYDKGDRNLYRLDSLSGWDQAGSHRLKALPSTRDSLLSCLDLQNSYHTQKWQKDQQATLNVNWDLKEKGKLSISLPVIFNHHKIYDDRDLNVHEMTQNMTALCPKLSFSRNYEGKGHKSIYETFDYSLSHTQPELADLLNIQDSSNPLAIRLGNPQLKNTIKHEAALFYYYSWGKHYQTIILNSTYSLMNHAIAQALNYNQTTGTSIYQPRNIDGNWLGYLCLDYNQYADTLKSITIKGSGSITYGNQTDYVSEANGEKMEPQRSSVRNRIITAEWGINYTRKTANYDASIKTSWTNLSSLRENFKQVNAVDIQYVISAKKKIFWDLEVNTSLSLYSRRGYNDASMNDNNLVWNADVTKSFLKSKNLILKLEGFDLLHQLDNVRTEVNAQGRTETWYNVVPSYMMLHLIYRLNVLPKKNK